MREPFTPTTGVFVSGASLRWGTAHLAVALCTLVAGGAVLVTQQPPLPGEWTEMAPRVRLAAWVAAGYLVSAAVVHLGIGLRLRQGGAAGIGRAGYAAAVVSSAIVAAAGWVSVRDPRSALFLDGGDRLLAVLASAALLSAAVLLAGAGWARWRSPAKDNHQNHVSPALRVVMLLHVLAGIAVLSMLLWIDSTGR